MILARSFPLLIALVAFSVFMPALWGEFLSWDDVYVLVSNPHYRGLGWAELQWMFSTTTTFLGHWMPVTWMTFGLDYVLWGMNPIGYHLTNILFHSANAAVFYLVAVHLLAKSIPGLSTTALRLGAAGAAAFFALHPLRAEVVAWVSARPHAISALFFLLTILTYVKASEAAGTRRQWILAISVACYALAVGAKSIAVVVPLLLVLLDIYPLRRFGWGRTIWAEKVPYAFLAIAGVIAELMSTPVASWQEYSVSDRIAMALHSLWFYLAKTWLPLGLSPFHPRPRHVSLLDPPVVWGAVLASLLTVAFIVLRRRWPAGLAVWASYVVIVAPVSGLVQSGTQLVADRYSYLSCLGWALLFGAAVTTLVRAAADGAVRRPVVALTSAVTCAWILALAAAASAQTRVWHDSETLWTAVIRQYPGCWVCHHDLGVALEERNAKPDRVILHLERALALRPANPDMPPLPRATERYMGRALLRADRPSEAAAYLLVALPHRPDDHHVLLELGIALFRSRRSAEAIPYLRRASELEPSLVQPRIFLSWAYRDLGDIARARRI